MKEAEAPFIDQEEFITGGMDVDVDGDAGMGDAADYVTEKPADSDFFNDFEDDFDDNDVA
jgi:hypothetical protein